jgi:DNA polymerase III subunit delta'
MLAKLLGNNRIKEAFKQMSAKAKVPRSLLFVGESGVGKKLFALELAKVFLCQRPIDFQACDVCSACKRASNFNLPNSTEKDDNEKIFFSEHPDIGLLRQAGKFITVKQIRELEREANFRPYEGKGRFFIIDNADKMNEQAQNALLKTLEEPAATTYILLITSRPMSLLQTIRSRCQTIRFAPISSGEIEQYLLADGKVSQTDAPLLSRLSLGSIGRASSLDLDKFRDRRDKMIKVLHGIYKQNRAVLLRTTEEICDAKLKDDYETHLEILQTLIHDVWLLKNGAENVVNVDVSLQLRGLAAAFTSKALANSMTEIETLRENLTVNLNKKIATDNLFLKMANF